MPVFDAHVYFGSPPGRPGAWDPQRYLQTMERFQIERAVLTSWFAEACDFVRGNAELDQALSQQERWLGYVTVNAHYPDESIEELGKYLGRGRFMGVRFHPALHDNPLTSPNSFEILSACRRFGLPILVSAPDEREVRQVHEAADEYTTLRFILTQMSPEAWEHALQLVETQVNVCLGTGSLHAVYNRVAEAVEWVGARRVLFTSGTGESSVAYGVGMMRDSGVGRREQEYIAYRNALEVFGLQQQGLPEWMEE